MMFEPAEIERDEDGQRTCGACLKRKSVSAFYRDGKDVDGNPKYRRDCKECYRITRLTSRRPPPVPKKRGRKK